MTDLATALVTAGAVVAGGVVTGLFTLAGQLGARKAEARRWERETSERNRTRFHETRLDAYANFLDWTSNAFGFLFEQARQRQVATGKPPDVGELRRLLEELRKPASSDQSLVEHPEFNQDAARRMTRSQNVVRMLAGSDDVRVAADELVRAVLAAAALQPDPDVVRWNAAARAIVERISEANQQFVDAANAELNAQGPGASLW